MNWLWFAGGALLVVAIWMLWQGRRQIDAGLIRQTPQRAEKVRRAFIYAWPDAPYMLQWWLNNMSIAEMRDIYGFASGVVNANDMFGGDTRAMSFEAIDVHIAKGDIKIDPDVLAILKAMSIDDYRALKAVLEQL